MIWTEDVFDSHQLPPSVAAYADGIGLLSIDPHFLAQVGMMTTESVVTHRDAEVTLMQRFSAFVSFVGDLR